MALNAAECMVVEVLKNAKVKLQDCLDCVYEDRDHPNESDCLAADRTHTLAKLMNWKAGKALRTLRLSAASMPIPQVPLRSAWAPGERRPRGDRRRSEPRLWPQPRHPR